MEKTSEKKPRGKRLKRVGLWSLVCVLLLVGFGSLAVLSAIGTRVSAPEWMRARITEKINSDIDGISIGFGDMAVVLEQDWVPRLSLRDVFITDSAGTPLANLSDLQSAVALRPLLRGKLQPGSIRLSGAQVTLRRSADGGVGMSVGATDAPLEEAGSFAELVEQLDDFLQKPQLADLVVLEADNLTLRYEDARSGRAWTVDGGRVEVTRDGDDLRIRGDVAVLGARDYATTLEMNYTGRIGDIAAEFGLRFEDMPARDIAGQSPALSWLDALDAPISGSMRAAVDEKGALGPLSATLQIGAGVLQPTEATRAIAFDSARSYFTYDPGQQIIRFNELSVESKWVSASAEGETYLVGMESGWPRELLSQLRVSQISVNPLNLYKEPVLFEAATMDVRLGLEPFRVSLGQLSIADQGQRLVFSGEVEATPEGWLLGIDGKMDAVAPERVLEIWPQAVKDKTRDWIVKNVRKAELSNIQVAVRSQPKHRPDLFLGFDFAGLETRFVKDVPVIENASGHASIYDNRFVIVADSGYVTAAQGGRIEIAGSSFDIADIRLKRGVAKVLLRTKSTITAGLSLLDSKPFRFIEKIGQPVTMADGQAELQGQLEFLVKPDLKPEEVVFSATGTLKDVRSETLLEGRVLASSELAVKADNTSFELTGKGAVGQVPFVGNWVSWLGPYSNGKSQASGWIELSERFVDEFNIGLPPGTVSGAGRGELELKFQRGTPGVFTMVSDLSGVGLRLKPLGWALSKGGTGTLEVSGTLGEPPEIDRIALDAAGLRSEGTVTLRADGQLDRAVFGRVRMGTWIDAPVELVGRGAGATPLVRVTGGTIDLRQTSLAGDGEGGQSSTGGSGGGPVVMTLDRLQISEGIALTDFRAELDMANGADGSFMGRVNGYSQIKGRVVPQNGRSAFRIQSDDAGGVFRSAGLLKQARDGELDLILRPGKAVGTYEGRLDTTNLRIKDAPAMAALLNALSVVGILEQMAGEGIHFGQVEAQFLLAPDRVTLYSGSAVGASMGISMDGYYFLTNGQMDMEGVISPLYLVNAIGGVFSRKGEGLIGFSYKLKGSASNPKVQVNPLSVLTPGMFREIFRRQPPRRDGEPQPGEEEQTQGGSTAGTGAER